MKKFLVFSALMLMALLNSQASEVSQQELERWFESDEMLPPASSVIEVNEGQLHFLSQPPDKPVHHHRNTLTISRASLKNGWVHLRQCHSNMDNVPRAEVTFSKDRVRELKISSSENIGKAWIEDNSVQLEDVAKQASLCIEAWVRSLTRNSNNEYVMRNGPFMRRFLDGYFPMRVSMEIRFADTGLNMVSVSPATQQGFQVWASNEQVTFDAWFEGRLKTEVRFHHNIL